MITTIIFDLSEVYLHGLLGVEKRLSEIIGFSVQNDYILTNKSEKLFNGEITEEDYWLSLIKNQQWNVSIETMKHLVRENMYEIEGTREIIEQLKERGIN